MSHAYAHLVSPHFNTAITHALEKRFYVAAIAAAGSEEKLIDTWKSYRGEPVRDPNHKWENFHRRGIQEIVAHAPDGVLPSELYRAVFGLKLEIDS